MDNSYREILCSYLKSGRIFTEVETLFLLYYRVWTEQDTVSIRKKLKCKCKIIGRTCKKR